MEDEIIKEDSEKTSEEEQTSEQSEEEAPDWKAKADAMYGKYKEEQEKRKELEQKLNSMNKPEMSDKDVDIDDLADRLSALQGLDASERSRLIKESKMQGVSLQDARKSDDFKFWRSAYRAELKKKNTPEPSTRQGSVSETDVSSAAQALREGTIKKEDWDAVKDDPEKRSKFLREAGLTADYSRYDKRQIPGVKRSRPVKVNRRIPYRKTTRVGRPE